MVLVNALSFFAAYDTLAEETISMYDYAGVAALAVFIGGVAFWVTLIFCVITAACRGIAKMARTLRTALRSTSPAHGGVITRRQERPAE